jgi:hypothetical protein
MNVFYVPTHFIFKMSYFRRSWLRKNFKLFFTHNHYRTHISVSSEPRKRGMVANDSQQIELQLKLLIHHLRWCIYGPGGPWSPKKDEKIISPKPLLGLPQPYILTFMTWHESLLCLWWSCGHFAHPISQVQKHLFTTFFCTFFPLWRPPQPEISKIQKSHEYVFCSHSLTLQNALFPKVVAS